MARFRRPPPRGAPARPGEGIRGALVAASKHPERGPRPGRTSRRTKTSTSSNRAAARPISGTDLLRGRVAGGGVSLTPNAVRADERLHFALDTLVRDGGVGSRGARAATPWGSSSRGAGTARAAWALALDDAAPRSGPRPFPGPVLAGFALHQPERLRHQSGAPLPRRGTAAAILWR